MLKKPVGSSQDQKKSILGVLFHCVRRLRVMNVDYLQDWKNIAHYKTFSAYT